MRQLLTIFIFISFISYGQDDRYDKLFLLVKEKGGLVVSERPMTMELDTFRLRYVNRLRTDIKFTDSLILQIVEASNNWDTTKWDKNDFKNTVVVTDRKENLNANKLLDDWGIADKAERKRIRKQINKWTNTEVDQRPINYLSRPILTRDNNYGLVAFDLVTSGLCCGGQVTLYKYESGQWKDLGAIYTWKH